MDPRNTLELADRDLDRPHTANIHHQSFSSYRSTVQRLLARKLHLECSLADKKQTKAEDTKTKPLETLRGSILESINLVFLVEKEENERCLPKLQKAVRNYLSIFTQWWLLIGLQIIPMPQDFVTLRKEGEDKIYNMKSLCTSNSNAGKTRVFAVETS